MPLLREPRDYAILLKALAQSATSPRTVIFGDSRAKAARVSGAVKICFGGAGIRDFEWLIPMVRRIARPRKVIVALGLNDARCPILDPAVTSAKLAAMLAGIPEVVICEPWPCEAGKQYSERFDRVYLARLAAELRIAAAENGWQFIPAPDACHTFDGAHFDGETRESYGAMLSQLTVTNGMSLTASH